MLGAGYIPGDIICDKRANEEGKEERGGERKAGKAGGAQGGQYHDDEAAYGFFLAPRRR